MSVESVCATSPTKRIFQPKIILVIRGQGIPQNSHHETDIMQEMYWAGGTQIDSLCVGMETATGQAVMVGFAGAWRKHAGKRQHDGKVSRWPLVMVELLALSY